MFFLCFFNQTYLYLFTVHITQIEQKVELVIERSYQILDVRLINLFFIELLYIVYLSSFTTYLWNTCTLNRIKKIINAKIFSPLYFTFKDSLISFKRKIITDLSIKFDGATYYIKFPLVISYILSSYHAHVSRP